MGEFKAQILAVLLVLGVFTLLNSKYNTLFSEIWDNVTQQVSNQVLNSQSQ